MNLFFRKRLSFLVLLVFCCTLWIPAPPVEANPAVYVRTSPFIDINNSHWSFGNVIKMNLRRVVAGHPDGTFKPDNDITHLEAVLMAVRNLNAESKIEAMDANAKLPISVPAWAEEKAKKQLLYALQQNLVIPAEKNFIAEQPATRAWMVQLMVRMVGKEAEAKQLTNQSTPFTDNSSIPIWAQGYVNVAVKEGLLAGYPDGSFKPFNKVTRAEAVAFMSRSEKFIALSTLYTGKILSIDGSNFIVQTANNKYSFTADDNTWSFDNNMKSSSWNQLKVGDEIKYLLNGSKMTYTELLAPGGNIIPVVDAVTTQISGTVLHIDAAQRIIAVKTDEGNILTYNIVANAQITDYTNAVAALEQIPLNGRVDLGINDEKDVVTIKITSAGGDAEMQVTIFQILPDKRLIIFKNALDRYFTYQYDSMLNVIIANKRFPSIEDLRVGDEVKIKTQNDTVTEIELLKEKQNLLVTGKLLIMAPERELVVIEVNTVAESYYLAANPVVLIPGYNFALLSDLRINTQVELTVRDGKVTQIRVLDDNMQSNRFTAKIAAVDSVNKVVVLDYNKELSSYEVHKNANLEVGSNKDASLSAFKKDMHVEVQLLDNKIIFMSTKNTIEGTVSHIDEERYLMAVSMDTGGSKSCVVSRDASIYIENVNRPRLRDIKPGERVSLEMKDDIVIAIKVEKKYVYIVDEVYDSSDRLYVIDSKGNSTRLYVESNVEIVVPGIGYPSLRDFRRGDRVEVTYMGEKIKKLVLIPSVKGVINTLDSSGRITVLENNGKLSSFTFGSGSTITMNNDKYSDFSRLVVGQHVEINANPGNKLDVGVYERIGGNFVDYDQKNNQVNIISDGKRVYKTYTLDKDCWLHSGNTTINFRDINKNDHIYLYLLHNKVVEIEK